MTAFIKKEIQEILRTYRFWAIPAIFLFLSLSAPASAKFLPDVLASQLEQQNITIQIPEPTAVDAFQAYFKNLAQMGLLAVILLTMGLVSEEKAKGVLAQVLAKPVRRPAVVVAKWLVHGAWFMTALALAAAGCYLYTLGLFGRASVARFAQANLIFAFYFLLIFSLTLAASTALRSSIGVGALALAGFFVLSLLPMLGRRAAAYSPSTLNDLAWKMAAGQAQMSEAFWPAAVAIALSLLLLAVGVVIFERQEL